MRTPNPDCLEPNAFTSPETKCPTCPQQLLQKTSDWKSLCSSSPETAQAVSFPVPSGGPCGPHPKITLHGLTQQQLSNHDPSTLHHTSLPNQPLHTAWAGQHTMANCTPASEQPSHTADKRGNLLTDLKHGLFSLLMNGSQSDAYSNS